MFLVWRAADQLASQKHRLEVQRDVAIQLKGIRDHLSDALSAPMQARRGLVAEIVTHGDLSPEQFDRFAAVLIDGFRHVKNVSIARGTVIAMVYPKTGNEAVLGLEYRTQPQQWLAVQRAISSRRMILDGPVPLVQGGQGLIARCPVFLPADQGAADRFFGMVNVVIDTVGVFKDAGLDDPRLPIAVAIRGRDALGAAGPMVHGDEAVFQQDPVEMEIDLPGGSWRLAAIPKGGWEAAAGGGLVDWGGGLFAVLVSLVAFAGARSIYVTADAAKAAREEELRIGRLLTAITEAVPDAIFAKDAAGRYILCNAAVARLAGRTVERMLGRTDTELFSREAAEETVANDRAVLAQRCVLTYERSIRDLAGQQRILQVIQGPLEDSSDAAVGVFGIARDITRHKQAESDLKAALAEADRANLAKSKFLAAASHDLRQPVQALGLVMEFVKQQDDTPPKVARAVRLMDAAVAGLHALLDGILDVSRLDAGVTAPHLQPVDVGVLLHRLCNEFLPACEQAGLRLRCRCRPGLMAWADPMMLERMVRNLMQNAVRYTNRGGVLVGARRCGTRLRIDVVDTGIGIPEDHLAHIFDEFYQVANPGRNRENGLGLGLAIVSKIARLMGAEVSVRSVEGRGSRFTVLVPVDAADQTPPPQPVRSEAATG